VLEIRFSYGNEHTRGTPTDPYVELNIIDPKTHILLWARSQPVELPGGRQGKQKSSEENLDKGIASVTPDLLSLASR
jgi:hypothetical protein